MTAGSFKAKGISPFKKRGYVWVTLGLFAISLTAHWVFAWFSYSDEQSAHGEPVQVSGYFNETFRDTMENWQSEFLQLVWQVAGLSFLWYIGSPQSKEEHDRLEEKIDYLIKQMHPATADDLLKQLETKYPKK